MACNQPAVGDQENGVRGPSVARARGAARPCSLLATVVFFAMLDEAMRDYLDAAFDAKLEFDSVSEDALVDSLSSCALHVTVTPPTARMAKPQCKTALLARDALDEWPRLESNSEVDLGMARLALMSTKPPKLMTAWLGGGGKGAQAVYLPQPLPPPAPIGGWRLDKQLLACAARTARPRGRGEGRKPMAPPPEFACASKVRGASRRTIGKQSRRERARRMNGSSKSMHLDVAMRSGQRADAHDSRLARLLGDQLCLQH